jgi:hypothetical protein
MLFPSFLSTLLSLLLSTFRKLLTVFLSTFRKLLSVFLSTFRKLLSVFLSTFRKLLSTFLPRLPLSAFFFYVTRATSFFAAQTLRAALPAQDHLRPRRRRDLRVDQILGFQVLVVFDEPFVRYFYHWLFLRFDDDQIFDDVLHDLVEEVCDDVIHALDLGKVKRVDVRAFDVRAFDAFDAGRGHAVFGFVALGRRPPRRRHFVLSNLSQERIREDTP